MRNRVCGVYKIENKVNHMIYVGISIDCARRKQSHICELNHNRHSNTHLQRAWNKYGKDSFEFSIIEICPKENLELREIYWISYYDSCNNGYNQTYGGDGTVNVTYPKERSEKISRALKGRKYPNLSGKNSAKAVKIICLDTGIIYDCIRDAAKEMRISDSAIICSCKNHIAVCNDKHIFAYWNDYLKMDNEEINEAISSARKNYGFKPNKTSKPIICLNTKEVFLNGTSAAKKHNAEYSYLVKCCKGLVSSCGKDDVGNGLCWMFLDEFNKASDYEIKSRIENALKTSKHNISIPVRCITTGEIFNSYAAAARKYNLYQCTLKRHIDTDGVLGTHPITNEPLLWERIS